MCVAGAISDKEANRTLRELQATVRLVADQQAANKALIKLLTTLLKLRNHRSNPDDD